ncbi:MAG TPA: DNA mismatch repair endonuclease MutL [Candidatus Krumholzibacteria bacterium]|nr:DNA mismatch repair endonuclease MutL [Candidatus Krumholzibacteria bacterium]
MTVIHTLPDDVARRIAAGEVVERPASVIKELFENAVDAGARSITVMTVGGGESLIEVRDDGSGMSREDVELAPRNFSTSKISDADDLERIATYGFRGEALASISAVSRFELISSDNTKGEGWRVRIEGKEAIERGPAPQARGTTVRVQDLFFNTPARKRFLKSSITERKRILETILSFALILPDVEIHYIDDGRHVLDLLPAPSWRERIAAVLGSTTMRQMVEVEGTSGAMRVRGFVSLPSHTRGNRFSQFFFVNNRAVRERTLVHALQDSYRNVIPYKRYPVAVLAVEMPAADVDVNVHPSKLEVRVRNEREVFASLRGAVKRALTSKSEAALAVGVGRGAVEAGPGIAASPDAAWEEPTQAAMFAGSDARIRDAFTDYQARRDARADEKRGEPAAAQMSTWPPATITPPGAEPVKRDDVTPTVPTDDALYWQFNQTFIFIQVRGGVVVIDQHAAHERVIFDWSMRLMQDAAPPSQQILFSIPIELSLRELEVFKTSRTVFQKLGFTLEPFGGTSILVRGYPQGLKNWADGHLLRQIFDDILAERAPGNTLNEKLIASYACRSAIKAGQRLSVDEMKLLADQLFAVDNPYSCPHGRPTIYRLSLDEIGRWFHRR